MICIPVLSRPGSFLLALPAGSVPPSLLLSGAEAEATGMRGPSTTLDVPAVNCLTLAVFWEGQQSSPALRQGSQVMSTFLLGPLSLKTMVLGHVQKKQAAKKERSPIRPSWAVFLCLRAAQANCHQEMASGPGAQVAIKRGEEAQGQRLFRGSAGPKQRRQPEHFGRCEVR